MMMQTHFDPRPGSNHLTLAFMFLLLAAVSIYQYLPKPVALTSLLLPSGLMMINFIIAMIRKKVMINKPALLVFHLALFVLVIELVIGQLTYLKGTVEVGVMQDFSGQLENVEAGPWHPYTLDAARFTNLGFEINYHEGIQRDNTINHVRVELDDGATVIQEIGDHIPLTIGHYRFYTSHNKGYAPVFTWYPADGSPPRRGSVHLPAYPVHEYEQARAWRPPGSQLDLWTMLVIDEELMPEDRKFSFRLPYNHHIVIRLNDERHVLKPGDRLQLADGVLAYDSLSSWMGYKVDYDWTRPWLLATCLLALFALSLHYLQAILKA